MTKIAHCTQGGESIDKAIAWAAAELEGFYEGFSELLRDERSDEAIFGKNNSSREIASLRLQ